MKYKIFTTIIILVLSISACELIVIGGKKAAPAVNLTQETSKGTVLLFKAELDSNNIPAAVRLLARPDGHKYLAFEKYALYDDVARVRRILKDKEVTMVSADTVNSSEHILMVEFGYIKKVNFSTIRIDKNWYISDYGL